MTLSDIAKEANFSVSTVSKAFNNAEDVSEDAKKIIFDIAKKHGVFGKYYKGKFSKKVIAIICPELRGEYYSGYVEKLKNYIEDNHGIALISSFDFDVEKQTELIDYYCSYIKVDGIFVLGLGSRLKKGYTTPIVSLFTTSDNAVDTVYSDTNTPLCEMIEYLRDKGHAKIGFIGEEKTSSKEKKFREYMTLAGLRICDEYIFTASGRFEEAGEEGAKYMLTLQNKPTAIVCGYDNIAVGAIKHFICNGFDVPGDFSVAGMDNIISGKYMGSALTTIDSGIDEMCSLAMELMLGRINGSSYIHKRKIQVCGSLVIRESTSAPRGND